MPLLDHRVPTTCRAFPIVFFPIPWDSALSIRWPILLSVESGSKLASALCCNLPLVSPGLCANIPVFLALPFILWIILKPLNQLVISPQERKKEDIVPSPNFFPSFSFLPTSFRREGVSFSYTFPFHVLGTSSS